VHLDKNDPLVDQALPFDGVGMEYVFVEKRISEEIIISRLDGQKILRNSLGSSGTELRVGCR
jgi:hypothetical protein